MKDNGEMARLPDLVDIADEFDMKLIYDQGLDLLSDE
ncbi:MAG: hypothetical protein U5J63_17425 [Fodinibius sp.]|nr:hypothetical protein [Fodinibius sp.]